MVFRPVCACRSRPTRCVSAVSLFPPEKLAAAAAALAAIAVVTWLYGRTRFGIALRAIADDRQAAMAVGINIDRHFGLVWAIAGIVSVCAGVLWVLVAGGGFGLALVGLKVFPIVVIAGLDSVPGTIVAAMLIGTVESLGAAYLDPQLGGGFGAMPHTCCCSRHWSFVHTAFLGARRPSGFRAAVTDFLLPRMAAFGASASIRKRSREARYLAHTGPCWCPGDRAKDGLKPGIPRLLATSLPGQPTLLYLEPRPDPRAIPSQQPLSAESGALASSLETDRDESLPFNEHRRGGRVRF